MPTGEKISDSTVRRLSGYYRALTEMLDAGQQTASSYDIAHRSGVTSAQLRKDLSCFGHFGKRGTGYRVTALHDEIRAILGLNRRWRVAVAGAGNLAHALTSYREFDRQGFEIVSIFDVDPAKIGRPWGPITVEPLDRLGPRVRELGVAMGIITTPAAAAQEVADRMVAAGIQGILNFASTKLTVPAGVQLRNVDMAIELETLSFALK